MEFDEKDTAIIDLLAKLKNADGEYPVELLTPRRQYYIKQLTEIGAFAGMGIALKSSSGSALSPAVAGKVLEAALVIAIVAEAGAMAFINRDRLAEIFRTISNQPRMELVSTPMHDASPIVELEGTATVSVTGTATPTSTPSPAWSSTMETAGEEPLQVGGTPDPKDNNGNHYGQTPKPERTKKTGNDNDPKSTKKPKND